MENLFPLIFIVIALISIINKTKKRPKPARDTKAPEAGWVQKLNAMLADIQQRLQQAPQGGASGPSPWERLLKGVEVPGSQPDAQAAAGDEPALEALKTATRPARILPVASERATAVRMDKTPPAATAFQTPAASLEKVSVRPVPGSRADLRKAVIWSEILGPPVALKDKPF
jgi:hypothetical protein